MTIVQIDETGCRVVPGTNTHAHAAAGPQLVSNALFGAFFHIVGPFFIAVANNFVAKTDRSGRTIPGTLFTFAAKVLKSEINGFVY